MPGSPPCLAIHHRLNRPGVDPIPPEWVDARVTIKDSVRPANIGRRLWELSGGVRYCACGGRHLIHTNAGRAGGRPQYHCVCSECRRHGSGACRPDEFHEA
jgi:hypothetical protein